MKNHIKQNNNDDFMYFQLTYPKIIETIRLSASPADIQIRALPKDEYPPEEIPYLIENASLMAEQLYKNKFISENEFMSIKKIDQTFESFDKSEYTLEKLNESANWDYIRDLSTKSLQFFSVGYAFPNIYWYRH